jgi:molecular chaperone GrpE
MADQHARTHETEEQAPPGHLDAPAPSETDQQAHAEIAELEDRWRRAVAELDNVRKRVARDLQRHRDEERMRVAEQWLPVLDNLDRALEYAATEATPLLQGVEAVRQQALDVMQRLGFPRVDDEVGQRFDPSRHEAVGSVADPSAPAGTVREVVRPGYGDGPRQLRPAAVVVATAAE